MGTSGDDDKGNDTLDVVIVGGGIAGLTCAVGLRDAGLKVRVIETAKILGGRAKSWIDKTTGDPVHIGPHIFLSEYPNFLALTDVLGTRDKIVWQNGQFIVIYDGQKQIVMKMAALPAPFHFVPSVIRDKTVPHLDKLSTVPATIFTMLLDEEDFLRLDKVSAATFLRSLGVSEYFLDRFWSFTSMSIMNVPLELCSAGALLRFYSRMVGHRHYDVGFPDGGLGDTFAPAAAALLDRSGIRVDTRVEVRRLLVDFGRVTGVELADGTQVKAKMVVAAVTPQALRRLVPESWTDSEPPFSDLVAFQPCPYVSTFLWFDRKITDLQFWARVHSPNDLNCDFYDLSNIHTGWGKRPSLVTCNTIWSHRADGMSDEEVVARTVREIAENIPAAGQAKVVHSVVNRIPMAIHCPYPGTESKRPPTRTRIRGLHLAGDWIKTGLPSSMESAAMSGWLAAEAVLEDVGRPRSLVKPHKKTEGIAGFIRSTSKILPLKNIPMWMHRI
jgi:uncharacterized protein with NAD-binding domain and iron-sulfur cluster